MRPIQTTSAEGLELIKREEKFVPHLYNDQVGHCTIGYGHLVHYGPIDGRAAEQPYKNGITEAQACDLLRDDVRQKAESAIRAYVVVPLSQNQFDALVSFIFNVGGGDFFHSTMLHLLNEGDYAGAAQQFGRFIYANHKPLEDLKLRRAKESALFSRAVETTV
jgi:GH24 family phage-related lysozyme (muramidase)